MRGAIEVANDIGYPVVVKPCDGNHGKGATSASPTTSSRTRLRGREGILKIHHGRASACRARLPGPRHRSPVRRRRPPRAGSRHRRRERSISELIEQTNADPRRGYGHEKVLTEIEVNEMTERVLDHQGLTVDSVPEKDREVVLKSTANLSTGGTAVDVTERVHPTNVATFERISRIIGLDICGIDVIADNLHEPLAESGGGVIEVNAAPGFRMHLAPSDGLGRNVAEPVIDMLFPEGDDGRIPVIAVTGTNGKTTTTRLLAHIMRNQGRRVGFHDHGRRVHRRQLHHDGRHDRPLRGGRRAQGSHRRLRRARMRTGRPAAARSRLQARATSASCSTWRRIISASRTSRRWTISPA